MERAHRANVLVTACLKTPVDPRTKAPLARYERDPAAGHRDIRDSCEELDYKDSCDEDCVGKGASALLMDYGMSRDRVNLSEIFFSNEEYYRKLEELKKAHLRTMAELESMYLRKLELRSLEPGDTPLEGGQRLTWAKSGPAASRPLRKSRSAFELRRPGEGLDSSDEGEAGSNEVEKGLQFSPKEHIKNMWRDFNVSPLNRHASSSSLHSLPAARMSSTQQKRKVKKKLAPKDREEEPWKHRITVPNPFRMMLREAERKRRGIKTRSEIEMENAELRRQLEELTESRQKFQAGPVPAHVHLPLYEELQGRHEERRRSTQKREEKHSPTIQKPFSFLERERLKMEQREQRPLQASAQEKLTPFRAKPVPKAVYTAASGEQMKEEELYRSIKIQMRAQEMLHSASVPPSMLARRLSDRKKAKDGGTSTDEESSFSHVSKVSKEMPDFNASHRRFQKHLERTKEVRPTTACQPFHLKTSQISHRERILADTEKQQSSARLKRWPHIGPERVRTPNSSIGSSLSGSLELLTAKATDATKKRHEAVRKVLEQRRKAEEEEERCRERQRQRERKLKRVVLRRAQANDPHLALCQTHGAKLKEFRTQDLQRRKEYQQEMKEMEQRVKGRPLLLEQVTQMNARQTAERRYADALRGCDLTEEFISSKVVKTAHSNTKQSETEEPDVEYEPLCFRKVFLNDEDDEADIEELAGRGEEEEGDKVSTHCCQAEEDLRRTSDGSYGYSVDQEDYSDDSEHDVGARQQEGGE
ncbi:protein FAM161A [Genypterus blacodes]|uniref:protein FAM161A n=1 Tax=Genypterus blacodes TaxID=154954 RepID=UPI003F774989